jgi:hypothetical protein
MHPNVLRTFVTMPALISRPELICRLLQVIHDGHRSYADIEQRLLGESLQTAVEDDNASLSTDVWSNGFAIDHNNDEAFDDPASLTASGLLVKSQSRSLRPPSPAPRARCAGRQID